MGWLKNLYNKIWYHIESLWEKSKAARRPFTYMMRDFLIRHKVWSGLIIAGEVTGLVFLTRWNLAAGFIMTSIYWFVMGHLIFGSPIKLGEQEEPPYIEPEH